MQNNKEVFKKRISLASLAIIFGVVAYMQFHHLLFLMLGVVVAALIIKVKDLPL
ncbi:hypothetical protein [[Eubacterium] hominis]|uniref:hypothetical protein n=1 Tax=[Eubacterium] hominis TaxID=2764325 RepID=UPI003A4D7030